VGIYLIAWERQNAGYLIILWRAGNMSVETEFGIKLNELKIKTEGQEE
jgi:hypothetical protein